MSCSSKVFNSISFCISYSYVRQLAGQLCNHDTRTCPHGTVRLGQHVAPRGTYTSQQSSEVVAAAAVADSTLLKLSLLVRAPACPRLRPRCCCCCRSATAGSRSV